MITLTFNRLSTSSRMTTLSTSQSDCIPLKLQFQRLIPLYLSLSSTSMTRQVAQNLSCLLSKGQQRWDSWCLGGLSQAWRMRTHNWR
ncbi:hypothetical protein FGO68_gene4000 [Halteria grandinella]|uniref:Uncharacterized protein n=1 Tax=Halteria grandinella TaxID=5974 RepID=A0A8J8NNU4_HALGN|nr:hypothetical protein FGO68_gene4000 [Halteria grandinella]